jgi:SPP1 family phage portal protein
MNGYLTQTEIINLGLLVDKVKLDTAKLKDLINSDLASECKVEMRQGIDYYKTKHDILNFIRYYNIDGIKQSYKTKINNRISHPFHKILVDQKVAYIAGNPITLSVKEGEDSEKVKEALSDYLGNWFRECISEQIKGASNKGFETLHFYVNLKGELKYVVVPAEQIIPIYDTQYQNELLYVIRYYEYQEVTIGSPKTETKTRYKVEWWNKEKVEYFVEQGDEKGGSIFIHDPAYPINPTPHWNLNYESNGQTETVGSDSWGKVPFVILWNNEDEMSDLHPIKTLIDAYDRVKSGLCNDIDEFNKLLFVLKGFVGLKGENKPGQTQLQLFIENFINEGAVVVDDDGSVSTIKGDIPLEARTLFLKLTKDEIFYFGEGVDINSEKLGGDPSGVALKFMFSNLDMKADRLILKLKSALDEFIWFPIEWLNRMKSIQLDPTLIDWVITKAQIFNEAEKVNMINSCKENISQETYLENLPFISDSKKEIERIEAEKVARKAEENEKHKKDIELAQVQNKNVDVKTLIPENK